MRVGQVSYPRLLRLNTANLVAGMMCPAASRMQLAHRVEEAAHRVVCEDPSDARSYQRGGAASAPSRCGTRIARWSLIGLRRGTLVAA